MQVPVRSPDHDDTLDDLFALEAKPLTRAIIDAYAAALRALAQRLGDPEGGPALQTTLTHWLLDGMSLKAPSDTWGSWREVRWDAAVDIMADAAAVARFFEQTAGRLDAVEPRRLNLLSLLKAKVVWRARDMMRRHAARAARRGHMPAGREASTDPQAQCVAGLVINRIGHRLTDAPKVQTALETMLAGGSITDAAAASGLSRQAIYRAFARLRRWVEEGK
ncbi:MAG: hypothetical protein ACI9U2_002187 [Bradymonadia bacterium]